MSKTCNTSKFLIKDFVDRLSLVDEKRVNNLLHPRIFLPTFQRDVVWKSKQICELWDSLMRGIPLPSLILSKVGTSANEIAAKSHGDNTDALDPQPEDFWLLDGQQRAMAILYGFGRRKRQRLWLDLAWNTEEGKNHGRRFGFFLCNEARPWGDNPTLDSRPWASVRKAREDIDREEPLNGRFDFAIPLTRTWPVDAGAPIPFTPLLEWTFAESTHTVEALRQQIDKIIQEHCPKSKRGATTSVGHNGKLDALCNGLYRIKETFISATVADIDVEDLLTAFTRFNRNATQVNAAELFFAGLKRQWPESQQMVEEAAKAGEAFDELDVLRGFTVLASQQLRDKKGQRLAETLLTPALLQTLTGEIGNGFDEKIQQYLESDNARQLLERTRDVLRYKPENDDDAGLPVVMLPRLRMRTWLPVLYWIERSHKTPEDLTDCEREAILRFVLTDHFFADWQPSENALLRDVLDLVADEAHEKQPFPCVAAVFARLKTAQKKSGTDSAWLKVVSIPGIKHHLSLPLSRDEFNKRFKMHCEQYTWPPIDDGQIWLGNRQDLLMWSQRKALDEWFGKEFLRKIAMLGEAGRPWDHDHLVPQDFFNNHGYAPEDVIRAALKEVPLKQGGWKEVKLWRNVTGNYRIWPLGFNRKDGNTGVYKKLTQNEVLKKSHVVLSWWWNDQVDKRGGCLSLADASVVDLGAEKWEETPAEKKEWTKEELIAFMQAVRAREQVLYGALLDFIWPGFAGSHLTDRFESPANVAGDTTDSSGLAEV